MQQMVCIEEQLQGLAVALAPEWLVGASPQERAARTELAGDAFQLLEDTQAAIDSGEHEDVVVALINAISGLAAQLRDRILDDVVASSPAPDSPPDEEVC